MKNSKTGRWLFHILLAALLFVPGIQALAQTAPTVTTGTASDIQLYQATVGGTINANGEATTYYFEYGTTTSYGSTSPVPPGSINGTTATPVSEILYELSDYTTYHYRLVATNASGTTYGADQTFTTLALPPSAITQPAQISGSDVTLVGLVDARGSFSTTVTFEYGTTTAYGNTVTAINSPVSGNNARTVLATVSGLSTGVTYHFRVVASNSNGTTYGDDDIFTLQAVAPTAVTGIATNIGDLSATFNGTVNPNASETSVFFEYGTDTSYGFEIPASVGGVINGTTDTAVSVHLIEFQPNTTYHFRVRATNNGGTTYGADSTFTTLYSPPTAVTLAATGIAPTSATLNGLVNANDTSTTVTFEYGMDTGYGNTVNADQSPVSGTTDTAVFTALSGLTESATYHYRVVAVSAGGTTYGSDMTFTTGYMAPTAVTNAASAIGTTTATLNGTVNANGGSTTIIFEYGPTTAYGRTRTADQSPLSGTTDTAVSFSESNLNPATTYHYRVVASNTGGTTYGADMTFTTRAAPSATTNTATGVDGTNATLNGAVNANGDSTTVIFEYGTSTAYGSSITADQSPLTGHTATAVSKSLTGLTSNTTYHFRVVASNANGTTYGSDQTFYTAVPAAPLVTTNAATSVISSGATLNGTVNANNSDTTVTFEYGTTITYGSTVSADQNPVTGGFNTAVSAAITGLSNNTTYHYRAVAVNAYGTTYGSDMTFSTAYAPAATTQAATNVGASSATLNGIVNGNNFSTQVTFEYGTTTSYGSSITATPNIVSGAEDTAVTAALTGLAPNTTYHFRVRAQGFGTTYGGDLTFTTGSGPSATTNAATSVSSNSATLNGSVNANGLSTTVYFEYGLSTGYGKTEYANQSPVTGSSNTPVIAAINGLSPNTIYHYRVVASNANDTVYGADQTFTTNGTAPSAVTNAATGVSGTGATLNGTVNANGTSTTVTFEYGTTTAYGTSVTAVQSPVTGTSNTPVSYVLSGLAPNTTYHFRVAAVSANGTANGSDLTFYTDASGGPTAVTNAATNITLSSATLNGTVNANGNSTTVTFEWGPSASYGRTATADQSPVTGTTDTAVSTTLTGLASNYTYHYRVVASNSSGTVYGADMTFFVGASAPDVTTQAATAVGTTTATLNGLVNANYADTTVTFEYGKTTAYGSTVTAAQSPVTGSTDTSVSANITGLEPNTTYHFRVVGVNSQGSENGSDLTFTTGKVGPDATTQAASSVDDNSATLNGLVNAYNDSTTVTFEWGTTTAYGNTATAAQSPVSGFGNTAVSANISGLAPNTTYHYRVTAQNSAGSANGADMTFSTNTALAAVTTEPASDIGPYDATLNGTVNANNDSTTVTFEYGETTAYGSVVTASQSPVTGNTDTAVSAMISGLTPETLYHYRVVAVNSAGTNYGSDMTFTTLPPQTPTVTTKPVTHIGFHTAKSGGVVLDEGASAVTARGVVWSTSPEPTLADNFTVNDYGPGSFNSTMNQLTPSTTYYVRAYATNAEGTGYGEEFEFTTDSKSVKVNIVKPKNGAVVSGNRQIQATASVNNSAKSKNLGKSKAPKISKVEFFIDDTLFYTDTKTPYKTNWDTTGYADGVYTIKAVATSDTGEMSSDSVIVTVNNTSPSAGTLTVNRDNLIFKAIPFGHSGFLFTAPQILWITNHGNPKIDWTISSDVSWILPVPKSGKGSGLTIIFVDPKGMEAGEYSAALSFIDSSTGGTAATVAVTLTVLENNHSYPPFGSIDSLGGSDVSGNYLPVSGWVLDDIEVTGVKIYRSPLTGEGQEDIYLGDATLLDDARPDVETLYSSFPMNYRAGWGFLLNTGTLPNNATGTFTLIAKAEDKEGHIETLGSQVFTLTDAKPRIPFGAIDTLMVDEANGSTVISKGWMLTPKPNMIPANGSTITVWVNGVPVGHPVYNQYRKDIADTYPGYVNGDGAGAQFSFDASSLAFGTHTMTWSVKDDAGNTSATGFRYFGIEKTGIAGDDYVIDLAFSNLGHLETLVPNQSLPVLLQKGFSPDGGVMLTDESGAAKITLDELEPLRLQLGENLTALSGYLAAGNDLRNLPAGATLDPLSGTFSWIPGPGFKGNYLLIFVAKDSDDNYTRIPVKITIE